MAALDLDDSELLVIALRTGLQLESPTDGPLGLVEPVESREVSGEPVVPVGPQRLGCKRLPGKRDRPLDLTESSELTPEVELRPTIIRRELHRPMKLRFRAAPVEISVLNQVAPGNVCSRKLGREAERAIGRRARL